MFPSGIAGDHRFKVDLDSECKDGACPAHMPKNCCSVQLYFLVMQPAEYPQNTSRSAHRLYMVKMSKLFKSSLLSSRYVLQLKNLHVSKMYNRKSFIMAVYWENAFWAA